MPIRFRAPGRSAIIDAPIGMDSSAGSLLLPSSLLPAPSFHKTPLDTLKRASGRLRQLLGGRQKSTPPRHHLLVVDDEESICLSMSEFFATKGFTVDTAGEVEEAEKLIRETDYEVIIQDLRLGVNTIVAGLEMISFVHLHKPKTRIVVLTAYGSAENEVEARRLGAYVFLTKPQRLSHLAQVVTDLIESPRKSGGH